MRILNMETAKATATHATSSDTPRPREGPAFGYMWSPRAPKNMENQSGAEIGLTVFVRINLTGRTLGMSGRSISRGLLLGTPKSLSCLTFFDIRSLGARVAIPDGIPNAIGEVSISFQLMLQRPRYHPEPQVVLNCLGIMPVQSSLWFPAWFCQGVAMQCFMSHLMGWNRISMCKIVKIDRDSRKQLAQSVIWPPPCDLFAQHTHMQCDCEEPIPLLESSGNSHLERTFSFAILCSDRLETSAFQGWCRACAFQVWPRSQVLEITNQEVRVRTKESRDEVLQADVKSFFATGRAHGQHLPLKLRFYWRIRCRQSSRRFRYSGFPWNRMMTCLFCSCSDQTMLSGLLCMSWCNS